MDGRKIKRNKKGGNKMMFLWAIFILFIIEGSRIAGRIISDKRKRKRKIRYYKGGDLRFRKTSKGYEW